MRIKQKTVLFTAIFALTVGLFGAILVASMPAGTAYAQPVDPCAEDGILTDMPTSIAECKKAVEAGTDPCVAIFKILNEDTRNDGTTLARDKRIECENVVGGPCSTEVLPAGYDETRDVCFDAVDNSRNPCVAIYDFLTEKNDSTAEAKQSACRVANEVIDCTPGEPGCCGGVRTSIIDGALCGDSSDTENGTIYKLLIGALNILTAGIGIAAVGGIAYGALLYTTAESKPDQTKKAIGIITNVVIGLVAYVLMYVLLNFLIPGGIFSS